MTKVLESASHVLWFGAIPASLLVLMFSFIAMNGDIARRIAASILFSFATFAFMILASFAIVLRDGLGPDSIRSEGMEAVYRSTPELLFATLVGCVFAVFGWFIKPK